MAVLMAPAFPAEFPVNSACQRCHPAETQLHERTRMAHAMVPAAQSAFVQNLPDRPLRESDQGFEFRFSPTLAGIDVTARRGNEQATGVIEWVLGAGAQGQTPLIEAGNGAGNGVLESRISYFPRLHQYGVTIGQSAGSSATAIAALGRLQNSRDLQSCIGCHASAITRDLQPVVPGVQCVRCHLGADQHARNGGKVLNPGKLSGPEQVRLCGNCHRTKPPVDDSQLENVRFQPLRLVKSECFQSGKLACTTCHVAHQDARRADPAFYNEKCRECHQANSGAKVHADARNQGDCISCHMPYVELHPALHFTDHYIRVVQPGDLPASVLRTRPAAAQN